MAMRFISNSPRAPAVISGGGAVVALPIYPLTPAGQKKEHQVRMLRAVYQCTVYLFIVEGLVLCSR